MTVDAHKARRKIQALLLAITDWRPFWPIAMRTVRHWMKEQFESQGAWGGEAWAALSPDYLAWKAVNYPGKPLLVQTGALKRAALAPHFVGAPTLLTITVSDPKAIYHQHGTGSMPARKIIPTEWPAFAERELVHAADLYLEEAVRRLT